MCFKGSHYAEPKQKKSINPVSNARIKQKKGMEFELEGTNQYNQSIDKGRKEARRQLASGAFSWALGDMITEEEITAAIAEFKLRTVDGKTQKSFSLKKEWLDKIRHESKQMKKEQYFLPFSFGDPKEIFVAMPYEFLLFYIQTIQFLLKRLEFHEKD